MPLDTMLSLSRHCGVPQIVVIFGGFELNFMEQENGQRPLVVAYIE